MSNAEVEDVAKAYMDATGQPLRSDLLGIPPEHRDAFLGEVSVQHEAAERAERMTRFAAGLFGAASTDINDGLRIKGGVPRDLPPILTDPQYALHRATQAVRREDAEAPERPSRSTHDDIRQRLVEPERTDIREGLTTADGRPTSFAEIASRDPDSQMNQQARARERSLRKVMNITGGRRIG